MNDILVDPVVRQNNREELQKVREQVKESDDKWQDVSTTAASAALRNASHLGSVTGRSSLSDSVAFFSSYFFLPFLNCFSTSSSSSTTSTSSISFSSSPPPSSPPSSSSVPSIVFYTFSFILNG